MTSLPERAEQRLDLFLANDAAQATKAQLRAWKGWQEAKATALRAGRVSEQEAEQIADRWLMGEGF